MTEGVFDAQTFGARGDGIAKDTAALQGAIDACAASGGGRVHVGAGRYLTGTLYLKSHVELHLQAGAVLLGSPDRRDYNPDDVFAENMAFTRERVSGAHLVIAYNAENVAITGQGTIDGHGSAFFEPLGELQADVYRLRAGAYAIRDWRPGQMVFFCRCRRVAVHDVALVNTPYWTLFLLGCDDVNIRGLTITNPPQTPNGDGIDIDCCRHVTVSDCRIRSGDDSITLRGNSRALGYDMPCEDVTITNCVLSTPCNAIRVGVGPGVVRNCTLSNIVVTDSRTGINMVSRYCDWIGQGTRIENIRFSDFLMDTVLPVQITLGCKPAPPAAIRNVSLCRFRVFGEAGSYIGGAPGLPIHGLQLADWDLHMRAGTDNEECADHVPQPYPVHGMAGVRNGPALPSAIYGTYLDDVRIERFRVHWDQLGRVWRHGLWLQRVTDAVVSDAAMRQPQADGAAIRCTDARDLVMKGCRALPGTDTFLRVESSPSDARARCLANDLADARTPFDTDTDTAQAGNTT